MSERQEGCVQSAKGVLGRPETDEASGGRPTADKEKLQMTARVGNSAPDFEAAAYLDGVFKNIRLSDYKGHWVILCFYPGDFTFV